jgi:UDP-N-acetylmuramoyl-tripeptide--D-alanyl-D-alanine ligase
MANNIKLLENNAKYNIMLDDKNYEVAVPVSGEHFVYNSLCAIAVGKIFGISSKDIIDGIATFKLTKKRMEILKNSKNVLIINDCYNASYDSMKAAIKYLATLNNRKIAILGDMLELGDFSEELHKKVGEEVAKNKIDMLITIGKEAKNIANGAKLFGMKEQLIKTFENKKEALTYIKSIVTSGDSVLIKASNGMKFDEITNELIHL